ncbi:MAG: hypothetical protein JWO94_3635 [Verrucomicrobiaceae bacterium]|nr:hypothetical protein [Verrucomicrobiaceae bacterium]
MHMMTTVRLWACTLTVAVSSGIPARFSHGAGTGSELPIRPRVAFVPAEVSIDGVSRPDIARAMADSFTAASLRRGNYRVFSMESQAAARPGKGRKNLGNLGSSAVVGRISGPQPADLDFLFTFNLIGDGNRYSLTMKKVRADSNEVLEAHEFATAGRLDRVFTLVPQALERVDARHLPPSFPQSQSPAAVRATQQPAYVSTGAGSSSQAVPLEWKNFDFSKVPKALIYRRVGSIMATNDPWRFCIINPVGSSGEMRLNDDVQVLWDDTNAVYAKLHVSSMDSGKVIADYGHNPSYHRLFPGDSVFGWAPPVQ